jgi:SAM-dependent methyltransferase
MHCATIMGFGIACGMFVASAAAQQPGTVNPVTPPPMTESQRESLASLQADVRVYEEFRYWAGFQPPNLDLLKHYDVVLTGRGLPPAERARVLKTIEAQGRSLEVERWNRILTAEKPAFNPNPNAFLVEILKGRRPGRALDVGMGQGRNALYLAGQGWDVTGFDPAERAVDVARAEAKRRNLRLTARVVGSEDFEWGKDAWDVIVLSYVTVRPYVKHITGSLAPGGLVVLEAFHRDSTKKNAIGGGVVYDSNELLRLFDDLRIIRYEDVEAESDFGPRGERNRVVRLAAQKP